MRWDCAAPIRSSASRCAFSRRLANSLPCLGLRAGPLGGLFFGGELLQALLHLGLGVLTVTGGETLGLLPQ